ncbi:hypothetical protein F5Y15DRAFT_378131 [Xylariaceae sp. FL0016]|nr:hypothetical protein F5Y15DRAFT_378131 [Xylariaceae sp. FL0016]
MRAELQQWDHAGDVGVRGGISACPISGAALSFAVADYGLGNHAERPRTADGADGRRRLRKRSAGDVEREIGDEEGVRRRELDGAVDGPPRPGLPCVGRQMSSGAFSLGDPFIMESGSIGGAPLGREDADLDAYGRRPSPEKQRGKMLYENRRQSSWIDEDALHGPRMSPRKGKAQRKTSWLGLGLGLGAGLGVAAIGHSLSRRLSVRRGMPELVRSPTLPCTETGRGQEFGGVGGVAGIMQTPAPTPSRTRSNANQIHVVRTFEIDRGIEMGLTSTSRPQALQHQPQAATYHSPRKTYPHAGNPAPSPSPRPSPNKCQSQSQGPNKYSPTKVVKIQDPNTWTRSTVALSAAHQLAGTARVPPSVTVGRGIGNGDGNENGNGSHGRIPQSNTDAELQAILRRTAERLNERPRRQTITAPTTDKPVEPSPAKSQNSAPAALASGPSELEGCSPRMGAPIQGQGVATATSRHTRQVSHVSAVSMLSEDSLMAVPSRGSMHEVVQTALSSPSRPHAPLPSAQASPAKMNPSPLSQQREPPLQQISRPYSVASSMSSALSTLYSEEEGSSEAVEDATTNDVDHTEKTVMHMTQYPDEERGRRLKSGTPLRVRRGTLGESMVPRALAVSNQSSGRRTAEPKASSPSLTTDDDPFTVATPPPPIPPRLSRLFSPLPAELPSDAVKPKGVGGIIAGRSSETPTPSPKEKYDRARVMPPPQALRAMTSSPTLGTTFGGMGAGTGRVHDISGSSGEEEEAASEAGLSSVYDSYAYGSETGHDSTVALIEDENKKRPAVEDIVVAPAASGRVPHAAAVRGLPGHSRSTAERRTNIAKPHPLPAIPSAGSPSQVHLNITVREVRIPSDDSSSYSQDETAPTKLSTRTKVNTLITSRSDVEEQADHLPPLPKSSASAHMNRTSNTGKVTSTIAELRRMNSQVSNISGHSTATTEGGSSAVSPTLAAMRGGGFSPGKASGGGRNYLALGTTSGSPGREGSIGATGNKTGESTVSGIHRGGVGRSRRGTVVTRFEEDLDRARKVLRERNGGNARAIWAAPRMRPEAGLVTRATKLMQEEGRMSVESLATYDEKGFLRSSPQRQLVSK